MTTNKKKDYTIGRSTSTYFAWFHENSLCKPQKIMPELGFSLQIEVYFLRGTYEFARPDHPNVYTFSRFVAEWSARCSICYDSHLNDAPKHIPQQHIHPAKTENYRMHLKTIKFAIKFNINAKTWLFIHYWLFLLKYSVPSQGAPCKGSTFWQMLI